MRLGFNRIKIFFNSFSEEDEYEEEMVNQQDEEMEEETEEPRDEEKAKYDEIE